MGELKITSPKHKNLPQTSDSQKHVMGIILAKLTETMSFRGAAATEKYFTLMTQRLSKENFEITMQALTALGERKREQGETALLDLGSILEEIRILTPKPKTSVELEEEIMAAERREAASLQEQIDLSVVGQERGKALKEIL